MVKLVPKYASFAAPPCLSVVSYNLLAPLYVRPIDKRTGGIQAFAAFQWAEPADEVLTWEVRRPRLHNQLVSSKADVICLQEVQFDAGDEGFSLPEWLRLPGYDFRVPPSKELQQMADRNKRVLGSASPIGNAVLWRTDRLALVEGSASKDQLTSVAVCVRGQPQGPLADLGPTAVMSVHLDATSEAKRVKQIERCLERARKELGTREAVIAGDLNTELLPGSCVEAFLADAAPEPTEEELARECASALRLSQDEGEEGGGEGGGSGGGDGGGGEGGGGGAAAPTAEQLAEWRELRRAAAAATAQLRMRLWRVPTGATRAAWPHGQEGPPCGAWRLDHLLYTRRTLEPTACWGTLEHDREAAKSGLPNRANPSDHLPVAASFACTAAPALAAEGVRALASRLAALTRAQRAEREELSAEGEARRQAMLSAATAAVAAAPATAADAAASAAAPTAAAPPPEGGAQPAAGSSREPPSLTDGTARDGLAWMAGSVPAPPPPQAQTTAQEGGGGSGGGGSGGGGSGGGGKKAAKGGKGGKERPSEAEIELKRELRELDKVLKAKHRTAREALVGGLGELELDALEGWLDTDEWFERGGDAAGVATALEEAARS